MADKKSEQTILVPVDFSECSESALLFACELALALKCKLLVMHVIHDPGDAPGYYSVKGRKKQLKRMGDVAEEMLKSFIEKIKKNPAFCKSDRFEAKLVSGLPVTRILEIVENTRPKMVVIGSHGRTGISRLLLGSKAEQLTQLCPVPVTVVKIPKQ
ncbi:MAG: universal stress protein [Gammaproteobacteria bacterium]|nr:MAG: universal stress protein [Gammaproteobacteria bacterium]